MRLNRFLARAGVAARRKSEALIARGAVAVNGKIVDEPGWRVVAGRDRVEIAGSLVELPVCCEYIALNKPRGCLVSRGDSRGRATVFEHVPEARPGSVAVGRLDRDTTGLLLLTDDGELAFRLMHPRFEVEKCYRARVRGRPDPRAVQVLCRGIELEDGQTAPARVRLLGPRPLDREGSTRLEICICEGRKRQVRRMCAAVGHPVEALERTHFAGLALGELKPGQWRRLEAAELEGLRVLVGLKMEKWRGG